MKRWNVKKTVLQIVILLAMTISFAFIWMSDTQNLLNISSQSFSEPKPKAHEKRGENVRLSEKARKTQNSREIYLETVREIESARLSDHAHPAFRDFFELHIKAVRKSVDEAQYRDDLKNPELRIKAEEIISNRDEVDLDPKTQTHRILAIDYLRAAAEWDQNPTRSEVLDSIQSLTKVPFSDPKAVDERLLKSQVSDRSDLYSLLIHLAPDRIPEVMAKSNAQDLRVLRMALGIAQLHAER